MIPYLPFQTLNYEEIELRLAAFDQLVSYSSCPHCGQQVTAGRFLCGHTPGKGVGYARSTVEPLKVPMPTPDVWKTWPNL